MRGRSDGERRLWKAATALVVAIYLSAYFVQFALDFLRERNLLRVTIGVVFAAVAGTVIAALVRRGAGRRVWTTLALVGVAYAVAALALDVVQERVHLLEYGALAFLLRRALDARAEADPASRWRSSAMASCGAFALAVAAGVGDELIQGALPNRVGEVRDVGLNALSAAMALAAAGALDLALAGDRQPPAAAP